MMKHIRRVMFEANRQEFYEFAIKDLYGDIPKKISDPGLRVMQDQKDKFDDWLKWQAFVLQQRMMHKPGEAQLIMGMLVQIKMLSFMLSGSTIQDTKMAGLTPAAEARQAREREEAEMLDKAIEGVGRFKKREKPAKPKE